MKNPHLILIALLMVSAPSEAANKNIFGQNRRKVQSSGTSVYTKIRDNYNRVMSNLNKYRAIEVPVHDTHEGGSVTVWFYGSAMQAMKEEQLLKKSKNLRDYYLEQGEISYVVNKFTTFRTNKETQEVSVKLQEDRFYFSGGKLISWISGKQQVPKHHKRWKAIEEELITDFDSRRKLVQEQMVTGDFIY